jgi:hypothetical protein
VFQAIKIHELNYVIKTLNELIMVIMKMQLKMVMERGPLDERGEIQIYRF